MLSIEQYRERLQTHALQCGYGRPVIAGNTWVFSSPEGAIKALLFNPTFPFFTTDYSDTLRCAKASLTREQNKARNSSEQVKNLVGVKTITV